MKIGVGLRVVAPRVAGRGGLELVSAQPVADGRRTPVEACGDLPDRQALLDQREQRVAADRPAGGVPRRVLRDEAVLVDPVADRRRVLSGL